jgi:hypothetical protein
MSVSADDQCLLLGLQGNKVRKATEPEMTDLVRRNSLSMKRGLMKKVERMCSVLSSRAEELADLIWREAEASTRMSVSSRNWNIALAMRRLARMVESIRSLMGKVTMLVDNLILNKPYLRWLRNGRESGGDRVTFLHGIMND